MCGAVRLARFNVTAQHGPKSHFQGLPIPAAAAALTGYTLGSYELWGELRYVKFLITLILGCSFLMVSDIEYEKRPISFKTTMDRIKWAYMAFGGIALLVLHQLAIFPLVFIYIVYGLGREATVLVRSGISGEPRNRRKKPGQRRGNETGSAPDDSSTSRRRRSSRKGFARRGGGGRPPSDK
jgi:CDP-diacylglycerol--serine O-phosphatidyltransferase